MVPEGLSGTLLSRENNITATIAAIIIMEIADVIIIDLIFILLFFFLFLLIAIILCPFNSLQKDSLILFIIKEMLFV